MAWGEKLSVPGVPSKPLSDVVNRAFTSPDVDRRDALRWLKDTLQKGELCILRGTVKPRPTFGGVDPALAGTEYAGIQVGALPGAPVDEVYLIDLEKLPSLDMQMLLDEMKASRTSDFGAAMEDLLVRGRADVDPPSPETFARDLERFVMSTAPGLDPSSKATTQVPEPQRAVCSMSTIRAALDGFGEACCWSCDPDYQGMLLCPTCGNKRCPRASDHTLTCTKSNEPGQPGSIYTQPPRTSEETL